MQIGIFGRTISEGRKESVKALYQSLFNKGASLHIYEPFCKKSKSLIPDGASVSTFTSHQNFANTCSLLITIGGDGTLLEGITFIKNSEVPILGINTGRLGFLTGFSNEEIDIAAEMAVEQTFSIDKRTLLQVITDPDPFNEFPFALNEATIHKTDSSSMITLMVKRNGAPLNTYWADGLIISTATGSTGYSLSCGGPIMLPESANFIVTPIAPHNLNVRPLVISDEDELSIKMEVRGKEVMLSVDSRSASISAKQTITIKKAPFPVRLVRKPDQDFLQTLREKLMWGNDKRN